LKERAGHQETGVFYSTNPGPVVALLPRAEAGVLNDYVPDLRKFFVDTDALLGAIKANDSLIALIGRERTSRMTVAQPLRVETVLLLASRRDSHLAQSYERTRAFAGKLLAGTSADLFGWDWAPILLSDALADTEFGSLLNFTDDILTRRVGLRAAKSFTEVSTTSIPTAIHSVRMEQ
jgi:hypothetical protein